MKVKTKWKLFEGFAKFHKLYHCNIYSNNVQSSISIETTKLQSWIEVDESENLVISPYRYRAASKVKVVILASTSTASNYNRRQAGETNANQNEMKWMNDNKIKLQITFYCSLMLLSVCYLVSLSLAVRKEILISLLHAHRLITTRAQNT